MCLGGVIETPESRTVAYDAQSSGASHSERTLSKSPYRCGLVNKCGVGRCGGRFFPPILGVLRFFFLDII